MAASGVVEITLRISMDKEDDDARTHFLRRGKVTDDEISGWWLVGESGAHGRCLKEKR
jgi:hypothetical protein